MTHVDCGRHHASQEASSWYLEYLKADDEKRMVEVFALLARDPALMPFFFCAFIPEQVSLTYGVRGDKGKRDRESVWL